MTTGFELLACPHCGSANIDPEGRASGDGRTGPACDECGATASSIEAWNRRPPAKPLTITGHQLREALGFIAPDGDDDQLEQEVCISHRDCVLDDDGRPMQPGMFVWLADYPEEGALPLAEPWTFGENWRPASLQSGRDIVDAGMGWPGMSLGIADKPVEAGQLFTGKIVGPAPAQPVLPADDPEKEPRFHPGHYEHFKLPAPVAQPVALDEAQPERCRTDGRCQYAIDHGAEGLGACPKGKCCMPAPVALPDIADSFNDMTAYKRDALLRSGATVDGFVMAPEAGDDQFAIVHGGAVRWLTKDELWSLMHTDAQPVAQQGEAVDLAALCSQIAKHLGESWLVVGPDGSRFVAPSPFRAAGAANKHFSRLHHDPAKAAEFAATLAKLRTETERENERLLALYGSLNCPACGGSGHVGDVTAQPPAVPKPPQFPTYLRKIWSGTDVQDWINRNWQAAPEEKPTGDAT